MLSYEYSINIFIAVLVNNKRKHMSYNDKYYIICNDNDFRLNIASLASECWVYGVFHLSLSTEFYVKYFFDHMFDVLFIRLA